MTVIAKEGKVCDALSTALFVMGLENAVRYWRSRQEEQPFDMILVTEEKEVYVTEEIKDRFNLMKEYSSMPVHQIALSE